MLAAVQVIINRTTDLKRSCQRVDAMINKRWQTNWLNSADVCAKGLTALDATKGWLADPTNRPPVLGASADI